jgi:hypothetical protein
MLVLICASTAIRAFEACGLKWRDIIWEKNQITIERRWTAACIDNPKTKASKAPVAMSIQLAWFLRQWRPITPYAEDEDWVFPSFKMHGKIPMCAGIFVTDHLRPAALATGIEIAEGQRFGLHSLRSSMATWMVSIDKTDVKTAQGNVRHAGPEIIRSSHPKCTAFRCGGLRIVGWVWVRLSWRKTPGAMQSNERKRVFGERGRIRTCDPCLKRALLYHLSYAPTSASI